MATATVKKCFQLVISQRNNPFGHRRLPGVFNKKPKKPNRKPQTPNPKQTIC